MFLVVLSLGGLSEGKARADAGNLQITPESHLDASGFALGPFAPDSKVYTLKNAGTGPLEWAMGADRFWVSLSSKSGNLAPGAMVDVTVRLNSTALNLPVTNDIARIDFINLETLQSDSRQVNLNIVLAGPATAAPKNVDQADQYQVTFTGFPGTSYQLERAPTVEGPWGGVASGMFIGTDGVFRFDASEDDAGFFRATTSGAGAVPSILTIAKVQGLDHSMVQVTGEPFGVYVLESSLNGVDWVSIHTNKLPASGEYVFHNAMAAPSDPVQYRALALADLTIPTLHHVLIVGESLALGFDGFPVLSTTPSESNYRFASQVFGNFFSPLREITSETIASGAADLVTSQAPLEPLLISNIGQNGTPYESQKKGTEVYASGLRQFSEAPQEAALQLFRYQPRAIFAVMGEGDYFNTNFAENIRLWQANYEADIRSATGHPDPIPMLHSQASSWTDSFFGGGSLAVDSPYQLLAEAEANPAKTILVGPRYFLPYGAPNALFPGVHPTGEGYRWLGEYYGKVYKKVVVDRAAWTPLKPASIVRAGNVITAAFDVPVPPLVLDTALVSNPGNYGFAFQDDSASPPAIVSVALAGPDSVTITLSGVPAGANPRLRYAYSAPLGNPAGPTSGPRGNLRDSDPTPSLHGHTLYNWCVHFDKPVN